jgi:hypothetical protein
MSYMQSLGRRVAPTALVALLCVSGTARAAEPKTTNASRASCADPQIEQPFAAFGDTRDYVLAPGGSFEDPSGSGWILEGGATVDSAGNPFGLRGGDDQGSLVLPPGATATSPTMCVDLTYPTMRFVGSQVDTHDADIDVEVLYPDTTEGKVEWHKAKSLKGRKKDGWKPTDDVKLSPERGGKFAGGRPVALRFTNDSDHGDWRVDDVYVDPRMK